MLLLGLELGYESCPCIAERYFMCVGDVDIEHEDVGFYLQIASAFNMLARGTAMIANYGDYNEASDVFKAIWRLRVRVGAWPLGLSTARCMNW